MKHSLSFVRKSTPTARAPRLVGAGGGFSFGELTWNLSVKQKIRLYPKSVQDLMTDWG